MEDREEFQPIAEVNVPFRFRAVAKLPGIYFWLGMPFLLWMMVAQFMDLDTGYKQGLIALGTWMLLITGFYRLGIRKAGFWRRICFALVNALTTMPFSYSFIVRHNLPWAAGTAREIQLLAEIAALFFLVSAVFRFKAHFYVGFMLLLLFLMYADLLLWREATLLDNIIYYMSFHRLDFNIGTMWFLFILIGLLAWRIRATDIVLALSGGGEDIPRPPAPRIKATLRNPIRKKQDRAAIAGENIDFFGKSKS
jgi:hypothetical protein